MVYITVLGDTWDMIAKKVYGTEKSADILMQNNPKLIDTFIFSAGTEVFVPDKTEYSDELPPWRTFDE